MGLESPVREMKPVEIVGVVLVRGGECEVSIAMFMDDVFGARSRFGEREASVLDHGCLACWIKVLDGLRGEDGGALVQGQCI